VSQPLLLTVVTCVQAPMDVYLIANDPVGVLLLLSPVLGCLFSTAFFSVMEGFAMDCCYGGFWCLIWRVSCLSF
jgi:hypothetical protein